jgi:hypothetical protein
VLRGRKRFFLFDYDQIGNLYSYSTFAPTPNYSHVDAQHPDFERFPRFRAAKGYEVTLEPGEMIFIPQGCWHQVLTEEPSVAINYWLGRRYFQRAAGRVFVNVSAQIAAGLALAFWRALGSRIPALRARARTGPDGTARPS